MDDGHLNAVKELDYAELNKDQEDKLREMEKQFNSEFKTAYYFMVMRRD